MTKEQLKPKQKFFADLRVMDVGDRLEWSIDEVNPKTYRTYISQYALATNTRFDTATIGKNWIVERTA